MDDGVSKVVEDAYHQYLDLEFGKKCAQVKDSDTRIKLINTAVELVWI